MVAHEWMAAWWCSNVACLSTITPFNVVIATESRNYTEASWYHSAASGRRGYCVWGRVSTSAIECDVLVSASFTGPVGRASWSCPNPQATETGQTESAINIEAYIGWIGSLICLSKVPELPQSAAWKITDHRSPPAKNTTFTGIRSTLVRTEDVCLDTKLG